ncbi:MAG: amino acid adenylation domain-containing protein, partial [Ketobacteraceae bacterium]|nr:amino acid adenylation domain-containing protein [Ketobacteraceae bacterium]
GINIGIPIAGRIREEVEPMIGMFINTAVISTDFSSLNTYRDLLLQVKEKSLGAYSHQALPFEKIVEELRPKRDLSRTPYFQVFFNLLNLPETDQDIAGLSIKPVFGEDHETHAKFDLNLYAKETPQGVQLNLVYNTDLFAPASVSNLLDQFVYLLQQIGQAPEKGLLNFRLAPEATEVRPDPRTALPVKSWPHPLEALASHARTRADRLAVKDTAVELSYQVLDQASSHLAAKLAEQGVRPGDTVAVYAQRNAATVVSLLAVLKTGAVFTVYDAAYPTERLRHYQTINNAGVMIDTGSQPNTSEAFTAFVNDAGLKVIHCHLDQITEPVAYTPTPAASDDRAYIAYTSGTTGEPKAISGSLAPVVHFVDWYQSTCSLTQTDRFTMLSGLAHDPLLRDIFTPLILGASLHIPDPAWYADPHELTSWLVKEEISVMHLTPAMAQLITGAADWTDDDPVPEQYQINSLRYAVFGGDRLTATAVNGIKAFADQVQCINFYGATETPQAMAAQWVPDMSSAHPNQWVAVGKGIDAAQLLIVNEAGKLADIGETGEIVIRSPYLSEGYLNRVEDSPFRKNPFTEQDNDTCYFTGDKGRYLPDGSVHFLGRLDQQIKIRGYRVEPMEVQHELNHYPGVKTSVVVDGVDQRGDPCLHAYLVLDQGIEDIERDELRRTLARTFPDYMIPSTFTLIDSMPLTPNGKLNRAALPEPDAQVSQQAYVAPETDVEKDIAAIWQTILKVEQIGIHDDFFALGGHSLLATQIVSRVREKYNVEFPLRALFQSSTVKGMADYIETTLWARGDMTSEADDMDDDDMEEFEI